MKFQGLAVFVTMAIAVGNSHCMAKSLCRDNEVEIFGCNISKKIISICAVDRDNKYEVRYLHYNGRIIDFEYPSKMTKGNFTFSDKFYTKGEDRHISFASNGYNYTIFNSDLSFRDPVSGIVVRKDRKLVSRAVCTSPYNARISDSAGKIMARTAFEELP